MPDNFNASYLATRKQRQQPEMDAMLAELDAMSQAPTPQPTQAPSAAPKKESSPGVVSEGLKAVGGGVVDAVRNSWNAIDDAATWLDNNFLDLRMGSSSFGTAGGAKEAGKAHKESLQAPSLPEWAQNKTTGGQVARSVTQFVVPFLGATKALKAVGVANTAIKGAVAGAATDFSAFDPHEKRLSNLVLDFTDGNPALAKPIFEYLAADPTDSNMQGRAKNTIEGLGLGIATEGLFKGLKAVSSHFWGKGQNPAQVIQEAGEASRKEAEDLTAHAVDTSKAPDMGLSDQINLITGVRDTPGRDKWQKRLDVSAAVKEVDAPAVSPVEQLKAIEADPSPRKMFLDEADGHVVLSKEPTSPTQIDLDTALPLVMAKETRTPAEESALQGYKELQEKALQAVEKEAPQAPELAAKEASDLDARIEAAQARLDALEEQGKNTEAAQKVLDNLLKKKDAGLYDHSSKLSSREAGKLATEGDSIVDAITANEEKLSKAYGRQQGGFITPSMLANLVAAQAGGVTGFMSAEDDASMAERLSLAGMGALAGMGIKVGASKVLKGHERAFLENPPKEVQALARKEVANIAPLAATTKKVPVIHASKVDALVNAAREGGMEALSKAVNESDFNFSRIDTQDDVKATIDAFSAVFEKETSLAKHGTQTFAEIKELAEELGAGTESLKELYKGTNNLAGRIYAHRALLAASAEQVNKLSRLAMDGDAEGILALRKQVALHASIQAEMKGVQTEVARALGQFRITASSIDLAINERNSLIEAMGGHAANIKFAQQLSEITDPKKLHAVIRKSALARSQDALFEAWVNGLLSGPATHVVNAMGNSLVAIGSSAERLTASMWGKVLRTGSEAVQVGEAKAHLFGMMEGMRDALSISKQGLDSLKKASVEALQGNFGAAKETLQGSAAEFGSTYRAFATDAPVREGMAFGSKEQQMFNPAITAEALGINQQTLMGYLADGLGALIRTPGRLLTTSDDLFWSLHYRGELKAQAYRTAVSEGASGDDLFKRIAELVEDPTPELSVQAIQAARQGTFTSPLGKAGASFQQAVSNTPGARYIVPFMRTPINIMKYVGARTPGLNLLSENVRAEFAAGGARRDMALARTTMGGSMYAMGAYLASQGVIVGGGEKNKAAEKLGGQQPYSIKVGDTYYAFNRADPFGMFLGIAADLSDISGNVAEEEMDGIASAAVLALSRNLMSKSYASGLVNLIEALSNPDTKGQMYLKNLAASWVPAAANAIRKEEDPIVREVWTVTDAIMNRIPGLSQDLPPALNVFGEEVKYKGGLGPDIMSPIATSTESLEPAAREIARLNIDLKHPPKTLGGSNGSPGIDLTSQQYHRLMQLIGGEVGNGGFKGAVTELVNSQQYKDLPEDSSNNTYMEAKEKVIRNLFETYKRAGTSKLLEEDADLRKKFITEKTNAANVLTGKPPLPF